MLGISRVLFAMTTMVMAVAAAAPAAADQNEYLGKLLPRYTYFTSDQLLQAGATACRITTSGRPASDAMPIVQADLIKGGVPGVSVTVAGEVVAAALLYLDC